MSRILVGTSSWADPGFVREWYPEDLPAKDRLPFYAERFEAVEVNATQYQLPEWETVRKWAAITPDAFTFDIKLHRLLSRHAAQARELPPDMRDGLEVGPRGRVRLTPEVEHEAIRRTIAFTEPLRKAGKMGAFLLQLTPAFAPGNSDLAELEPLLENLTPIAVEFRHRGWVEGEQAESTFSFLADHGAAFVCVDAPQEVHVPIMPPVDAVTNGSLAYIRMHGRNAEGYMKGKSVAERFGWVYADGELEEIAGRVEGLAEQASEVHVMFNNNRDDDAPTAARRFRALLGQDPGPEVERGQQRLL
jgi:uncharacterized protein YecE (DUF72 family)